MWVVALPSPPAPAALIAVSLSFVFSPSSLTVSLSAQPLCAHITHAFGSTETLNPGPEKRVCYIAARLL